MYYVYALVTKGARIQLENVFCIFICSDSVIGDLIYLAYI